jgi:serine/threonine protein kinase
MTSPRLDGLSDLVEVGRGAYGLTYRARHQALRRNVAVKVLNSAQPDTPQEQLERECRLIAKLARHPNIVRIYTVGTTSDGHLYLVMPFFRRGSLAERTWRRGPMSWQAAVRVGVQLAGGLQTAHDARVLHRDVKPGNVLVSSRGAPQLTDFGQAGQVSTLQSGAGPTVASPAYAAPEVLRGTPPSMSADVYSLAATLVALIHGRAPHSRHVGENIVAVMNRVLNDAPVDLRQTGVPDEVCEVLEWALEKEPRRRPPTAAVFGKALQGAQRRLRIPATELPVETEANG